MTTQQQRLLQTIIKKANIPNQCIPFVCVFIIAKTPTILLAGIAIGYYVLFRRSDTNRENRLIESVPPEPPFVAHNYSLEYDDNYASISQQEDQTDTISNASIDFESLMKFPSCPTTLPRLDTHFNFVSDDHHLRENSPIDWSAIHQELVYDNQRNPKAAVTSNTTTTTTEIEHHPIYMQNDMLTFSSSSSSSGEDEEVSSLLSLEAAMKPSHTCLGSDMAPLSHGNTTILSVDHQSDQPSTAITSFTSHINNMALAQNISLLPSPTPLPRPRPSLSSPGQLFKTRFKKAVKKMKKSSSNSSRRSSIHSQDSFIPADPTTKKASSLHMHSFFPTNSLPRPSKSARINDHFKGRFNKLFKK